MATSRAGCFASRSARGRGSPAERRSRIVAAKAVTAALLVALAGAIVPAAPAAAPRASAHPAVILSDETTFTTWSVPARIAPIRARPAPRAGPRGLLRWATPDGFQQTYLLLRERIVDGEGWILLRIPGRPNGRVGWVRGSALGSFHTVHTSLLVDREADLLTLYRDGRVIFRAPVGTGKPTTPTPAGHYWITEAFPSSDPAYGPWAFGTADYSTLATWADDGVVGLHGTDQPALIPGHPSHGCIRLRNRDIVRLKRLVPIGTPLRVI